MENISPVLLLAYNLRRNIKSGRSVSYTVNEYIRQNPNQISFYLLDMLKSRNNGKKHWYTIENVSNHTKSLFHIIWSGLNGKSIQKNLDVFIYHHEKFCLTEIEGFLTKLPFKLLLPLLFLQFPAFLILLFGPIIDSFKRLL